MGLCDKYIGDGFSENQLNRDNDESLKDLFPDGAWQRGLCKQLQTADGMLLFDQVVAALPSPPYKKVKTGKATKARTATEVWYVAGQEAAAKKLAADLKKLTAVAKVDEWKWGGEFDLLVVVGPPE